MSTSEKLFKRIISRPYKKDITFAEAEKLLLAYGFSSRQGGKASHVIFTHPDLEYPLNIPKDGAYIKAIYVKNINEAFSDLDLTE